MKNCFLTLLLFCSFYSNAQIQFEEGYYIDNSGNRVETLIRNKGWLNNPTDFTYQSSPNSSSRTATIQEVMEFGVGEHLKYIRFTGEVDISPQHLKSLDDYPEPKFLRETVFLKVLLEGEVDLYKLKTGSKERYYIKEKGQDIQPLIFKKYLQADKMATNYKYRNQLYSSFNCQDVSAKELTKIDYKEKDLLEYFKNYHICRNSDYKIYKEKGKIGDFNLSVKGGIDFSSLEIESGYNAGGTSESYPPNLRLGVEAEVVFPFLRNKWGVFLESTYRRNTFKKSYMAHRPFAFTAADLSMELNYITLTGGIRHYMFVNESSKLFINFAGVVDAPISTHILFERDDRYVLNPELETVKTSLYFSGGLGFNYNNGLSAEVRYELPKRLSGKENIPGNYFLDWRSTTSTVSLILGYRFF